MERVKWKKLKLIFMKILYASVLLLITNKQASKYHEEKFDCGENHDNDLGEEINLKIIELKKSLSPQTKVTVISHSIYTVIL
jgi:hypothetical protein